MFGPTPLRDVFLVAGFELREMTRSRRMFLFGALYLIVAAFGSYTFVDFLTRVQPLTNPPMARERGQFPLYGPRMADRPPPPPATPTPAADSTNLQQGRLFQRGSPFRGLLRNAVTEPEAVDFLVSMPAITLFHMLISLAIMPFVIMLTSSESIAQEHQTRGMRFIALRTGRAEFVLGKVLGQGVTIAMLTLLAGGVCIAMAAWKLQDFEFFPTLSALLLFWPRLCAYCAAFLGLAALCSMNSSSTVASRTFALLGLISLWIIHHFMQVYLIGLAPDSSRARLWRTVDFFTPYSHQNDLWYPEFAKYGGAMAALLFLGAFYVIIGLITYRERDL